ncbi:DUF3224 domain-containing protein [Streptomyces sp. NPDC090994]|uniref:DUF3224 domain-containing protein n=1 Tax=Streptomyces sp. NPDC090994 TaxID=3365969 RepID=UPI0038305A55
MPGTRTTGHFTAADWKEHPLTPADEIPRVARASVTNSFTGGIEASGTVCEYVIVYVPGATGPSTGPSTGTFIGTFTGMELLTGRLDGREGTFAVEERGSFDADGTVHCAFEVVAGSGTGELTGVRGTGEFTARHGEASVAYAFTYELG